MYFTFFIVDRRTAPYIVIRIFQYAPNTNEATGKSGEIFLYINIYFRGVCAHKTASLLDYRLMIED